MGVFRVESTEKIALFLTKPGNVHSLEPAILFYVGKWFYVRGGGELRKPGPSQFVRTSNPECFTFVECGSKNRCGVLEQLRLENQCVPCCAIYEMIPQCLVFLLDFYLSMLPPYALTEDVLYCTCELKCISSVAAVCCQNKSLFKNPLHGATNKLTYASIEHWLWITQAIFCFTAFYLDSVYIYTHVTMFHIQCFLLTLQYRSTSDWNHKIN